MDAAGDDRGREIMTPLFDVFRKLQNCSKGSAWPHQAVGLRPV
jgi:hypothetical protein